MNDDLPEVLLPGDKLVVTALFDRIFPWEASPEEFLEEFEADVLEAMADAGYGVDTTFADVSPALSSPDVWGEGWFGQVGLVVRTVPVDQDGEPIVHEAGIPLVIAAVAALAALGLFGFISYKVLDTQFIEAAEGALDKAGELAIETRKLVAAVVVGAVVLWAIAKYGKGLPR